MNKFHSDKYIKRERSTLHDMLKNDGNLKYTIDGNEAMYNFKAEFFCEDPIVFYSLVHYLKVTHGNSDSYIFWFLEQCVTRSSSTLKDIYRFLKCCVSSQKDELLSFYLNEYLDFSNRGYNAIDNDKSYNRIVFLYLALMSEGDKNIK